MTAHTGSLLNHIWFNDDRLCAVIDRAYRQTDRQTGGHELIKTVEWTNEGVRMIDQRKLPTVEEYPLFRTYDEVAEAIRVMVVRGAPAIGVAAAMGVALGVRDSKANSIEELKREFDVIVSTIGSTRPTAVNLFWALDRMKRTFHDAVARGSSHAAISAKLIEEAQAIYRKDIDSNMRMGK